jgi:hypothetical protein
MGRRTRREVHEGTVTADCSARPYTLTGTHQYSPHKLPCIFGYREDAAADIAPFLFHGLGVLVSLICASWYPLCSRQGLPILRGGRD